MRNYCIYSITWTKIKKDTLYPKISWGCSRLSRRTSTSMKFKIVSSMPKSIKIKWPSMTSKNTFIISDHQKYQPNFHTLPFRYFRRILSGTLLCFILFPLCIPTSHISYISHSYSNSSSSQSNLRPHPHNHGNNSPNKVEKYFPQTQSMYSCPSRGC